jgi:ABC-2 type transport system ATP-binding protein
VEAPVRLDEAVKDYGSKRIGPITFSVRTGEILGFLGPNGSGKSTTIRMLLGLIRPTSGIVRLADADPLREHVRALRDVGYSPELPNLQSFLTPGELLHLTARELGLDRGEFKREAPLLLEKVGLTEYEDGKIGKLSKGMVQRLSVAQAMVGSPRVLILDEPMIGIDPAGVVQFRSIFRQFVNDGGTIIMSSHVLSEVESLCSSLAVIHSGKVVFRGGIEEFIRSQLKSRTIFADVEGLTDGLLAAVAAAKGVRKVTPRPGGLLVEAENDSDPRSEISRLVVESGAKLLALGYSRSELDDAYLSSIRGTSQ